MAASETLATLDRVAVDSGAANAPLARMSVKRVEARLTKLLIQDAGLTHIVDLRPKETLVVGRSFDCGFQVRSEGASRRHVILRPDGDGHSVEDAGSTNGTLLNAAPLTGSRPIKAGDVVTLGACTIQVFDDPPRLAAEQAG